MSLRLDGVMQPDDEAVHAARQRGDFGRDAIERDRRCRTDAALGKLNGGVVTRTIARIRLAGKMAHDDLVCPPPVPPCDHPARRLALCAFHAQLSRRRRSARGARSGCLLRNGAAMGIEVRAIVRPRTSPSTPSANVAMMEWMPPPDGIAMCQGGDVCRIPRNEEGIHEKS